MKSKSCKINREMCTYIMQKCVCYVFFFNYLFLRFEFKSHPSAAASSATVHLTCTSLVGINDNSIEGNGKCCTADVNIKSYRVYRLYRSDSVQTYIHDTFKIDVTNDKLLN